MMSKNPGRYPNADIALSVHALSQLRSIVTPQPRQDFNSGVVGKLEAEALIETYFAPSPYPSRRGAQVQWVRITQAGRDMISGPIKSVGDHILPHFRNNGRSWGLEYPYLYGWIDFQWIVWHKPTGEVVFISRERNRCIAEDEAKKKSYELNKIGKNAVAWKCGDCSQSFEYRGGGVPTFCPHCRGQKLSPNKEGA